MDNHTHAGTKLKWKILCEISCEGIGTHPIEVGNGQTVPEVSMVGGEMLATAEVLID